MSRMDDRDSDMEFGNADLERPAFGGGAEARHVAPGTDVHVNLGQSFMPREPTYERIILMELGTIVQKFHAFGWRDYARGDPLAYEHMRSVTMNYMMRRASQVPHDRWPDMRARVLQWWKDLDAHQEQEWHISLAMAEIEHIMYETGLGLLRKPQPTKFDATRSDNNAAWLTRLTKDRARKLEEVVVGK